MLDVLRKNSKHWLVTAIIAIIIVGLAAFFGTSAKDNTRGVGWAAKVDGETIKMGEFLNRYRAVVENYRAKLGPNFDEKMLESLNIKTYILKSIVDEKLAAKAARENGLGVSDEELRDNLMQYPAFQKEGKFSMEYYKMLLSYNRIKPSEFERMQREEMQRQRLRSVIFASAKASDAEILNAYRSEAETAKLAFVSVNAGTEKDANVTSEDIKKFLESASGKKETTDYYTNHNDEFRIVGKDGKAGTVRMYNDVKEEVARNILMKKRESALSNNKVELALKAGNIEAASKVLGQKIEVSSAFSRKVGAVPGITGSNSNDVLWAFGLDKGKIYKRETGGKIYLVTVKERTYSALDPKKPDFEQYKQKFITERGSAEYMKYMEGLEKKWSKKVEYSPYLLNEMRGPRPGA